MMEQAPPKSRLDQQVYRAVREALMKGSLRPGQAITHRGLADTLNVSRQPAYAALNRLQAEGALVAAPKSGTLFVPLLSETELEELRDIRVCLEGLAASKAACLISNDELEIVENCCRQLADRAEAGDSSGYALTNWEFHAAVYRASRSPMLCASIEQYWLRIGPYVSLMMPDRATLVASIPRHWDIVKALRRRDGKAASKAVGADIALSAAALAEVLRADENRPRKRKARPISL